MQDIDIDVEGDAAGPVPIASVRQTWRNVLGNQIQEPLFIATPRSLEDLVAIVRAAEREGITARAVGSGHSFSDVTQTSGYLVRPEGLTRVLPVRVSELRPHARPTTLFRVEGGMRLEELVIQLERVGLALPNLPACAWQTVAGAIATATHGSGLEFGTVADALESIKLVGANGRVYQIEPSDGITDPERFFSRRPDVKLVQDDAWFHAAMVAMGCLGIVYAVTLRVQRAFTLEEKRRLLPWSEVREMLRTTDVLRQHRHVEVAVDPYPYAGDHQCVVTTRDEVAPKDVATPRSRERDLRIWLASTPALAFCLTSLGSRWPNTFPWTIRQGMRLLETHSNIGPSHRVFDLGPPNRLRGYSTEVALPIEATAEAVDELLHGFRHRHALADFHPSLPISLRFVRQSKAFLAMNSARDTCFVESAALLGTVGAREQVLWVQEMLLEHGGRPHWGQMHHFTEGAVEAMYPELPRWMGVAKELNRTGVFNNTFSDRLGLSGPSRPMVRAPRRVADIRSDGRPARHARDGVTGAWDEVHLLGAADGCKLALYEYAPRDRGRGHPILMTHSLGCDAHVWDLHPVGLSLADHLRGLGFHVFTLDHRGRGRSDRPETGLSDWTLDDYVLEDLPCALHRVRSVTGAKRVHLVGHSLGGLLCHLFHIRHGEEQIRSIVTFGSSIRYAPRHSLFLMAKLFPLLLLSPNVPIGRFYRALSRWAHVPLFWNTFLYHCANVRPSDAVAFARVGIHAVARGEARQLLRILQKSDLISHDGDYNYTENAHLVTAPLLALGGDRDVHCPEEALRWTLQKVGCIDKQLRIFGRIHGDRSHYGHLDLVWGVHAPHDVWPVVDRWLEDHDEPRI
jgi:FAD/FMN-containing dehydrogenase/pimeloyl-ACP methyl ester carboxylesterase